MMTFWGSGNTSTDVEGCFSDDGLRASLPIDVFVIYSDALLGLAGYQGSRKHVKSGPRPGLNLDRREKRSGTW